MSHEYDADVLIVGAGPVGLTMAMDLAARGVSVLIAETRHYMEPPSVKCNHVSARTMERWRTLGVAAKMRAAGLPPDYPHDVAFRTAMTGTELSRVVLPSPEGRRLGAPGDDTWWPTPEPPHRINQIMLEPILLEHVAALPGVRLLNRTEVGEFEQVDHGVVAHAVDLDSGAELALRARYMVGCDGGRSAVRKRIGAQLSGTPVIQRVQSSYIRAPGLKALLPGTPAWGYYSLNPRRCGTVFAIDGRESWLVHNHLAQHEDEAAVDRDRSIREILGVGPDFEYEILSKEDWVGRRLVADRLRNGRVFIAGDACHLWMPYAGYGMNAGIADALNLSWLLGGVLAGWADEDMLDVYEMERQPITDQVSRFAMNHAQEMMKMRGAVPANIEALDAAGEGARAELGRASYELNVQQFAAAGLNFGYFYPDSPVIVYDGEPSPAYTMGSFTPSTAPGCRMPHCWLADGRSLYDAFGPGYTLLRLDRGVDVARLQDAARDRGVPLVLVDLAGSETPALLRHRLYICRSDQHIAWRGDEIPADSAALIEMLRGARVRAHRPAMTVR